MVRFVKKAIEFVFRKDKLLIEPNVTVIKLHLNSDQYDVEFITIFINIVFVMLLIFFFLVLGAGHTINHLQLYTLPGKQFTASKLNAKIVGIESFYLFNTSTSFY